MQRSSFDSFHFVQSPEPVARSPIDIAKLLLGGRRTALVRDPDGHAPEFTEP